MSRTFSQSDLVNVDKYSALIRLLVDNVNLRPFTMQTPFPLLGQSNASNAMKIKEYSRLKYGRDRQAVEAEIINRMIKIKK
jgi:phenylalanyl-tRNA synthetase beta subunit